MTSFLKPVADALDEALFGTSKTSRDAPHISDGMDLKRYMGLVIVALLPAVGAGVYFYGLRVLAVILISYVLGGTTEVVFSIVRKKPVYEGFLITGLIFPLVLPPTIPLWMVGVGIVFGVLFGKEVFGGTGRNIFNPALAGRVFLVMAFPERFAAAWNTPFTTGLGGLVRYAQDAVTAATPLIDFKSSQIVAGYGSLLLGTAPGSIGETFRAGIILGGLFLAVTKIADWRIPLSYIVTVAVVSSIAGGAWPDKFAPPLFQVLSGGLLFGAFFMATDPVTSPLTFAGRWIYGVSLGVLTVLIRALSGFPEGVMFSILLMNGAGPLLDSAVLAVKFRRPNK